MRPSPTPTGVTSSEGGQAIIDTALCKAWGRVDIVINNAGIVRDAPFEDITADPGFDPLIDAHLKGAFYVTQARMEDHARAALPGES